MWPTLGQLDHRRSFHGFSGSSVKTPWRVILCVKRNVEAWAIAGESALGKGAPRRQWRKEGIFLVVQWFRLTLMQGAWVQTLVGGGKIHMWTVLSEINTPKQEEMKAWLIHKPSEFKPPLKPCTTSDFFFNQITCVYHLSWIGSSESEHQMMLNRFWY